MWSCGGGGGGYFFKCFRRVPLRLRGTRTTRGKEYIAALPTFADD